MPLQTNKIKVRAYKKVGKFYQKKKFLIGFTISILIILVSIAGKTYLDHRDLDNEAAKYQVQKSERPVKVKNDLGAYNAGDNVSSLKQLRKYHNQPGNLNFRGYIAVPKQKGVTNPIASMQINEGSTDPSFQNKAMSYGAVTDKSNQIMGEVGNFTLAAHSFDNGHQFFSPMNNGIDVNKRPKMYMTDGKQLFIYQFNKGVDKTVINELESVKDYDDPAQIPGMRIVDKSHGSISNDSVAKGKAISTIYSCDEEVGIFNINPQNRIVMTAMLDETKDLSQATDWEKSLFPQLNE